MSPNAPKELLSIGEVAQRVGLATSAIRFYEDKGLVQPERNAAGHRRYRRSTVRRLSFILIAQQLGYGLNTIKAHLATLPSDTAPADEDWERLARQFGHELDQRIAALTDLRNNSTAALGAVACRLSVVRSTTPTTRSPYVATALASSWVTKAPSRTRWLASIPAQKLITTVQLGIRRLTCLG